MKKLSDCRVLLVDDACWLARDDTQSRSARGLVAAILLYNFAVAALLAFGGFGLGLHGVVLWPAVVLHAVMAMWCVACLRRSPQTPNERTSACVRLHTT
jgi:hypothetical protein